MPDSESRSGPTRRAQSEDAQKILVQDVNFDIEDVITQREPESKIGNTYGSLSTRQNVQGIDDINTIDGAPAGNDNSSTPQFSFSTTRVWIAATLIIVIYIIVLITMGPLTAQYLIQRIVQDNNYNLTVNSSSNSGSCSPNSTHDVDDLMSKAQKEASSILMYNTIASAIPSLITCLFAGSVSDFLGRKLLIILSLSGAMAKSILLCIIINFKLDIHLIYIGAAVDGIFGSYFVITTAITAVIADVTTKPQNKAVRFAAIEGVILVGGALSQLGTGFLIKESGFFIPTLIASCFLIVAFLITIFILPETIRERKNFTWNLGIHIKKTFSFYFSKRIEKHRRCQFIICLAAHMIIMAVNIGKSSIETIYVMNSPICWGSVDIGVFNSTRMIVMSLTAVLVLKLSKNCLSLEVMGMICGISSAAGFILEGFAYSTLFMSMSALAGILFTTVIPLPRTLLSQLTSSKEQGALFSSLSCTETIVSIVATTVFTLIYKATLDTFRGAVFMILTAFCVIYIAFLGAFRYLRISNPIQNEFITEDEISQSKNKGTFEQT